MNFLKNMTLLMAVVVTPIISINHNIALAGDFESTVDEAILRARRTSVVDLTKLDFTNLTEGEFGILVKKLEDFSNKFNMKPLAIKKSLKATGIARIGVLDISFEEKPIKMIVKMKLDGKEKETYAFRYNDAFYKTIDNKGKVLKTFFDTVKEKLPILPLNISPNRCWVTIGTGKFNNENNARIAITETVDGAYDSGYIDLIKDIKAFDIFLDSSSLGYHKDTTFFSSLIDLAYNYDFDSGPVYIFMQDAEYGRNGIPGDTDMIVDYIKKFIEKYLGKDFSKKIKIVTKKDNYEKYIKEYEEQYLKYILNRNIIDLTAIRVGSYLRYYEKHLTKLIEPTKRINFKTRIIYSEDDKRYSFVKNVLKIASEKKECKCYCVDSNDLYKIRQHVSTGFKTGQIVFDSDNNSVNSLSWPAISKILLKSYKIGLSSNKKEKLNLTMYADFTGHEDIQKKLDDEEYLNLTIKKFDKETYDYIREKIQTSCNNGNIIDLKDKNLGELEGSEKLDLIIACIENHLASSSNEQSIKVSMKISKDKEQKKKDKKVFDKIKKMGKKYKNFEIIEAK